MAPQPPTICQTPCASECGSAESGAMVAGPVQPVFAERASNTAADSPAKEIGRGVFAELLAGLRGQHCQLSSRAVCGMVQGLPPVQCGWWRPGKDMSHSLLPHPHPRVSSVRLPVCPASSFRPAGSQAQCKQALFPEASLPGQGSTCFPRGQASPSGFIFPTSLLGVFITLFPGAPPSLPFSGGNAGKHLSFASSWMKVGKCPRNPGSFSQPAGCNHVLPHRQAASCHVVLQSIASSSDGFLFVVKECLCAT